MKCVNVLCLILSNTLFYLKGDYTMKKNALMKFANLLTSAGDDATAVVAFDKVGYTARDIKTHLEQLLKLLDAKVDNVCSSEVDEHEHEAVAAQPEVSDEKVQVSTKPTRRRRLKATRQKKVEHIASDTDDDKDENADAMVDIDAEPVADVENSVMSQDRYEMIKEICERRYRYVA